MSHNEIHYYYYEGAEQILGQIKDREQHRLLELEKKDQETQAMLRYLERLQEEDHEALEKKRDKQKTLMAEVTKSNAVWWGPHSMFVWLTVLFCVCRRCRGRRNS